MAPATFSFQVQIPKDDDITTLRGAGYQLGVRKSNIDGSSSTIPVQWLSAEILGSTITVSWEEEYFLYFTSQDLAQDGVRIMQGSSTPPAILGHKYSYNAVFTDTGMASRPDGIDIENDLRPGSDTYGIAQKVSKNGQIVQAPIIATNILMKGTAGFTFGEEVEVYFTNSPKYTGSDGIVMKYLDVSSSANISLKRGVMSAVAYDLSSGNWTHVEPAVTDVPRALAAARASPANINTLEELFAFEPALDVNNGETVFAVLRLAMPIVGENLVAWINAKFRQSRQQLTVTSTNPHGVNATQTVEIRNNGNMSREQISAAAEELRGQYVPIVGGRYLAAPGLYQTVSREDIILSVEIMKQDATVAALRLILGQLAAAKKASGLPTGTNGAYAGYLSNAALEGKR